MSYYPRVGCWGVAFVHGVESPRVRRCVCVWGEVEVAVVHCVESTREGRWRWGLCTV